MWWLDDAGGGWMNCNNLTNSYPGRKPRLTGYDRITRYTGPVIVDGAARCNVECALDPKCVGFFMANSTTPGSFICTLLSTADFNLEDGDPDATYYPFQSCPGGKGTNQ